MRIEIKPYEAQYFDTLVDIISTGKAGRTRGLPLDVALSITRDRRLDATAILWKEGSYEKSEWF